MQLLCCQVQFLNFSLKVVLPLFCLCFCWKVFEEQLVLSLDDDDDDDEDEEYPSSVSGNRLFIPLNPSIHRHWSVYPPEEFLRWVKVLLFPDKQKEEKIILSFWYYGNNTVVSGLNDERAIHKKHNNIFVAALHCRLWEQCIISWMRSSGWNPFISLVELAHHAELCFESHHRKSMHLLLYRHRQVWTFFVF